MTARRTSGSVGFGGAVWVWFFFPPGRRAQPQVLEVGEGNAAHQRMSMQPGPRSPLERAEPEFLLELLVRLLANPACLDGRGEPAQRRIRRQIAQIIFPLAAAAPLAHQPDLLAGQMAVAGTARPIGDPHAPGRETRGERPLAAAAPSDPSPSATSQHVRRLARRLAGHGMLAWLTATGPREQQPDAGGEHLLVHATPTDQIRLRALRPWRNGALWP